jgi:hypothetical protein
VIAKPGISYSELLLAVPGINADDINRLIAIEKLFINFNTAPLAEPNQVRIFPTREKAEIYEQKALSGLSKQEVNQDTSEVQKLLLKARPIDLETANARYEAIKPYLEKNSPPITKANRSLRRWRRKYYEAQKLYGENHGYVGLLPKHLEKGHHQKLEPALLEFMADFIKKHFALKLNGKKTIN